MGAKAKQAITEAVSALSGMGQAVANLETNYKELFKAMEVSIALNIAVGGKGGDVEKAKTDVERKKLQTEHEQLDAKWKQARAASEKLRAGCRNEVAAIKSSKKTLDAALKAIETLAFAKQKQRDSSKNVLKKIVNMAKTKSLADLKAEYARIAKANNDLADKLMGIDPFFFKE